MNTCKIDFKKQTLDLTFKGNKFLFNLRDGDQEDYWNSFQLDGNDYDVNLYVPDDCEVLVSVYEVTDGIINTMASTPISVVN